MINCENQYNDMYKLFNSLCGIESSINIVGIYPEESIENVLSTYTTSNMWVQIFQPEVISLDPNKADIDELISIHSCIEIISQRVIKTPVVTDDKRDPNNVIPGDKIPNAENVTITGKKLIVEGMLNQKIVYIADVEGKPMHTTNVSVPISVFIAVGKDTPLNQVYRVDPYIEDLLAYKLTPRSIYKNTTIFFKATPL